MIAAIFFSPLLLILWERPKGINWNRLGDIGQTYDGTSAVLSAIALLAVAASLVIQARQSRHERVLHSLDRQFDLLNLVLERPNLYGPLVGWSDTSDGKVRQRVFVSLWINMLQMRYEMNTETETEIRKELQLTFMSDFGRQWWHAEQQWWSAEHATSKAQQKFDRMLHEEYGKVISGDHIVDRKIGTVRRNEIGRSRWSVIAGATIGACAGLFVGSRLKSR